MSLQMEDILPSAIQGAGSVISSGANILTAAQNRKFQEKMSNTAIQRRVKDARAAGVNPLYFLGEGASSPQGNVATTANPAEGFAQNYTTSKTNRANRLQMAEQTKLLETQGQLTGAKIIEALANAKKSGAEVNQIDAMIEKMGHETKLLDAQTGESAARTLSTYEQIKKIQPEINKITEEIKNIKENTRNEFANRKLTEAKRRAQSYENQILKIRADIEGKPGTGHALQILDTLLGLLRRRIN